MGTFVVYIDNAGEFRWYLIAANNRKIADAAEGYRSRQDCEDAIRLMKRLVPKAAIEAQKKVETLIAS
jgi:uncharacterized protein YegP (UPF0339 family)